MSNQGKYLWFGATSFQSFKSGCRWKYKKSAVNHKLYHFIADLQLLFKKNLYRIRAFFILEEIRSSYMLQKQTNLWMLWQGSWPKS